jgi:hypothetical protein
MAGPFVTTDLFEIKICYVEKQMKSGHTGCVVLNTDEAKLKYKDQVKEISTQWSSMNWRQSNDLIRKATKVDADTGIRGVDWPYYRSLLMESCLKAWDIQGSDSKTVPCINDNIGKLDPNIASAMVEEYLAKTTPSEKELGE